MQPPVPPHAFTQLVGERLTVDMLEVAITEVEVQPGRTRHVVQLLLWVRQRPSHGTRNCVFVTCSQDKPPTWVLSELRRRELHAGYRYELLSKPS